MPVPYNPANPDWSAVRRIFFDWLRANPDRNSLDNTGASYGPFVEYADNNQRPSILAFHVYEVFWQALVEGILAPGTNSPNPHLPWFHVTEYGRKVLDAEAGHPHDEAAYLEKVRARVARPDGTVLAYLAEAVATFRRGTPVASTVMLGIAAERVFLMVCESMLAALRDPGEQAAFDSLLQRFPMKPKLDWVQAKIAALKSRRMPGLPDNTSLMVTAVYDFLRTQRNDLGHPRDLPPTVDREDAFVNLQMFPRYYQVAEELRHFLATNPV
jgi:hypothetical protein